jgi:hypothetical protein
MKLCTLTALFLVCALATAPAFGADAELRPPAKVAFDAARYQLAVTSPRGKLFERWMNLKPAEAREFWTILARYEKERDEIVADRAELLSQYVEWATDMSGEDYGKAVHAAADTQVRAIKLRIKYFDQFAEKINLSVAGRFAQIDDYIATAQRLELLQSLRITATPAR